MGFVVMFVVSLKFWSCCGCVFACHEFMQSLLLINHFYLKYYEVVVSVYGTIVV